MREKLPTTYVFLDTSIYEKINFNYDNPLLQSLKARISSSNVVLGITDITINEIKSRIHERVFESQQVVQKFRTNAKILRNCKDETCGSLFYDLDFKNIESELNEQFEKFIKDFIVDIIDFTGIDIDKIFSLYFSKKKPFGDGKKKNEFPDAFVLEMLRLWADSESTTVYVASLDKDFIEGVENFGDLKCFSSLPELISVISDKYEEIAPLCLKLFEYARNEINNLVISNFSNRGFYISDQQGHVNDVSGVKLEEYVPVLLAINPDNQNNNDFVAIFEIISNIYFNADISYDDLDTASYDSEDKVLIPHFIIDETVESFELAMITVSLKFQRNNPDKYEIVDMSYSGISDDIGVESNRGKEWPYK